jgi:hypothetical protein
MRNLSAKQKPKPGQEQCAICGRGVNPNREVEVELSNTDGEYYKNGVPEGHESQGWFTVGPECAKGANIKKA